MMVHGPKDTFQTSGPHLGVVVKISKQVAAQSTGFKARDGLVSPLKKTMGRASKVSKIKH